MIPALVFLIAVVGIGAAVVWAIGVGSQPTEVRVCKAEDGGFRHVPVLTPRQRFARLLVRVDNVILRKVGRAEVMPRGYGFAWMRYDAPYAVFMPVPLNLFARVARAAWLWAKRGGVAIPSVAAEAYAQGRTDERATWVGWQQGPLD